MGSRRAMLEGMEEDKDRESFAHGVASLDYAIQTNIG
jgi:hypothetical protein